MDRRRMQGPLLSLSVFLLLVAVLVGGCGGSAPTSSGAGPSASGTSESTASTTGMPATSSTAASSTTSSSTTSASTSRPAAEQSDIERIRLALAASGLIAEDFSMDDYLIRDEWAGVVTGSPTVGGAMVLLVRSGDAWQIVTLGSDLSQEDLMAEGASEEIAQFLSPWETLAVIKRAIAESGSVAVDFDIADYRFSEDRQWAGVIITSPGVEDGRVLATRSGGQEWRVVDLGTGQIRQDWLDNGAPPEVAEFLSPGG